MKKIALILILLLGAMFFYFAYYRVNATATSGTIIILNGPSSVGKSSIQKELQELFTEPYLSMGFDNLAFLPTRFISINGPVPPADQGIYLETTTQNGHQIVTIHYGGYAQKMVKGIHRTFAAFASVGNNIIVDYILYDSAWLKDLAHVLKDYNVYWIGVNAPLEIIEEREKQRGNRLLGHARSHYHTVHGPQIYDLMIDNTNLTPKQSAQIIKDYVTNHKPQALRKLSQNM